jgi:hypothetical protein
VQQKKITAAAQNFSSAFPLLGKTNEKLVKFGKHRHSRTQHSVETNAM